LTRDNGGKVDLVLPKINLGSISKIEAILI
jgi:hypothetical protein